MVKEKKTKEKTPTERPTCIRCNSVQVYFKDDGGKACRLCGYKWE